jgi:hypothetical protein
MHDRPTITELLDDVADLLDDEVVPVLDGGVKHHVRVAANLCRIVEREVRLGPALAAEEERLLRELLPVADPTDDIAALHGRLVRSIRSGDLDDDERVRQTLLRITRGKLSVVKPGYDDFDFSEELGS